jgi:hypothetical protein
MWLKEKFELSPSNVKFLASSLAARGGRNKSLKCGKRRWKKTTLLVRTENGKPCQVTPQVRHADVNMKAAASWNGTVWSVRVRRGCFILQLTSSAFAFINSVAAFWISSWSGWRALTGEGSEMDGDPWSVAVVNPHFLRRCGSIASSTRSRCAPIFQRSITHVVPLLRQRA